MTRTVMDATDIKTGKKIYFNGHAQATFMADGSTVEDNINASKEKLNTLNLVATDIVSVDGLAYVLTTDFESKMNELGGLLDEINGLFVFYIDDEIFQSPEQMTWGAWMESKYNIFEYTIEDIVGISELDIIIQDNKYITYDNLSNGVYVVDLEGNLLDSNAFTGTADDVTGIGLVTDKTKMIIALDEWYSKLESTAWNGNIKSAWGGYNKTVPGCWIGTSGYLNDFDGEANTDAIIAQLKDTTDDYSQYYTGAPAAEYCRAYSKGYKDVGSWYLPAAGEFNEILLNKDAINAILTKLGKNNLSKNFYTWSSSQSRSTNAWYYNWSDSYWYYSNKYSSNGVRPICKL